MAATGKSKLDEWMRAKKVSAARLAERTRYVDPKYYGVSAESISNWRRGRGVNVYHAMMICQATNFAVNVHDLVRRDWYLILRNRGAKFFAATRKGTRRRRPPV